MQFDIQSYLLFTSNSVFFFFFRKSFHLFLNPISFVLVGGTCTPFPPPITLSIPTHQIPAKQSPPDPPLFSRSVIFIDFVCVWGGGWKIFEFGAFRVGGMDMCIRLSLRLHKKKKHTQFTLMNFRLLHFMLPA